MQDHATQRDGGAICHLPPLHLIPTVASALAVADVFFFWGGVVETQNTALFVEAHRVEEEPLSYECLKAIRVCFRGDGGGGVVAHTHRQM